MEEVKSKRTVKKGKKDNHGFKTTEVIVLVLLTCISVYKIKNTHKNKYSEGYHYAVK